MDFNAGFRFGKKRLAEVESLERKSENLKELINEKRGLFEEEESRLRDLMRKGYGLEDPIEDFSFFHYGTDVPGELGRNVQQFFCELDKFKGQAVLENFVGYAPSRRYPNFGNDKRSVNVMEINKNMTHSIRGDNRTATLYGREGQNHVDGGNWTEVKRPRINLTPYAGVFAKSSKECEEYLNQGSVIFDDLLVNSKGIRIDIKHDGEFRIGGRNYNADPHHSLIVGDEFVREYLSEENLETVTSVGLPRILG